jgi:hypothetical protein
MQLGWRLFDSMEEIATAAGLTQASSKAMTTCVFVLFAA